MKTQEWRLSLHQGIVLIEFDAGTVINFNNLKGIYAKLNSKPSKYRTTNMVWDLRNIELDLALGYGEITQLVKHIKNTWDKNWTTDKSAMVVKSKAVFGMTRMYAALVEVQLPYEVQVFDNDIQSAIDWARPSG